MAMRLDLAFARPLTREQKLALAAALAAQPKVRAVRFLRSERTVAVIAEDLGRARITAELAEVGLVCEAITTSLADDSRCDDAGGSAERVRAPGR